MIGTNQAHVLPVLTLVAAAALTACGGTSPAAPGGTGGSKVTGAGGGGGAPTDSIEALTDCMDDDIQDGFSGPGYDAEKGGLQPPVQSSYVAATTVLLMSSDPMKSQLFGQLSQSVLADISTHPGFIGMQVGISSKCHYARTLTVWKDMDSMMEFVAGPVHAHAMENAANASDAGATTHWDVAASDMPPTWAVAREKISGMGHLAY